MDAFDRYEFAQTLAIGAHMFGIEVPPASLDRLTAHAELVMVWNERAGLTTIVAVQELVAKHYVDSLSLLRHVGAVDGVGSLVDVGSGAGFPGLVLAICASELRVTLLEASAKKAAFLRLAATELGLAVTVIHERAEDFGRAGGGGREGFRIGVARAAAPLAVSCEYVLPLVANGGTYLAQLGPRDGQPLAALAQAGGSAAGQTPWGVLGGDLERVVGYDLPWQQGERYVATFRKRRNTPAKYPRKAGTPERRPLPGFAR
jgi:16S rRNA (guanine527-N7)-methyltransferase